MADDAERIGPTAHYTAYVWRRAGLPQSAVTRARQILAMLEAHDAGPKKPLEELPLFAALAPSAPAAVSEPEIDPALVEAAELIESSDPDSMTPREAHELLYRLKAMLKE